MCRRCGLSSGACWRLTGFGVDPDRIRVIVNRWHKGDEEALKSIEKETKRPCSPACPTIFARPARR